MLIPPERSGSIHPIAAAEILHRYDEEHFRPPAGQEDEGGWISDSRQINVTFVGSSMEINVKAGDLRALDRALQCKIVLEALKNDPKTIEQPPPLEYLPMDSKGEGSLSGTDVIGKEVGATGFARTPFAASCASPSRAPMPFAETVSADTFRGNFPESESGMDVRGDGWPPGRRRKKKKAVTATDGVVYELPTYVQNVDTKLGRSTLRLKMPLSGYLVNEEPVSVTDVVVAYGLEVSRKNLLALRYCVVGFI